MINRQLLLILIMLSLLPFIPSAQSGEAWYRQSGRTYEKRVPVTLTNPLPAERLQQPVIVRLADIAAKVPDFPGRAFVVVDPGVKPVSPCRIENGGNDIPAQLDDLDGDGKPDELVFLADLPANAKKTYHIYYTSNDLPLPQYPKRTQITTFAECDPNTLFAIESDQFMFRLAGLTGSPSDGFNSPGYGFDMFGKYKDYPGYYQHLFHKIVFARYGGNGTADNKTDRPRGRSILYPEGAPGHLGIGALFIRNGDKMFFPTSSNITCRLPVNGTIRSVGEIQVTGWEVGNNFYDARVRYAMYAGHPFMECNLVLTRSSGNDPGDSLCVGMMKIDNMQKEIGKGHVLLWGNRAKIWAKDVGMAMLFDQDVFADVAETDKGYILPFKAQPQSGKTLETRLFLSGAWGKAGYFATKEAFFDFHRSLGPVLLNAPGVAIGAPESIAEKWNMQSMAKTDLFLSNPSNKKSILPVECDLESLGYETGAAVASSCPVDTVPLYGEKRVFIDKSVDFLQTEKLEVKASDGKSKPSFDIKQATPDGEATVTIGKMQWMIGAQGLKQIVHNGKVMELEQTGASGPVKVIHNGAVCAIVRVGDGEKCCDYYFYKDERLTKVVAGSGFALTARGFWSYVAKKEIGVEGCEQGNVNRWGRIASEKVFGIHSLFQKQPTNAQENVIYPAEWGALYSATNKVGLMFYGTPSAERMTFAIGAKMDSQLPDGRKRQTIYLSPLEDIAQGEERSPLMSPPFVAVKTEGGFISCEDRTGNEVEETVFIEDGNTNGMPDFTGDRWLFDTDSDDTLQMVLEFGEGEDRGRPGRTVKEMRVYCDTISGSRLHSSVLSALFGDLPTEEYPFKNAGNPKERGKYDGVLGPGELEKPFSVYQDWDGDGLFCNGPVTEGGFVASGRITDAFGGPYYQCAFAVNTTLESLDLDDDGDNDIWMYKADTYIEADLRSPCTVDIVNFDFSDNNLDPVTVINPYTGRAYWATRYSGMQSADNLKYYQSGVIQKDGTIVGGRNWPMAGTWDVDNDGKAEAQIYYETARPVLGLDLLNRFSVSNVWDRDHKQKNFDIQGTMGGRFRPDFEDLAWVRERWHFQKEIPNIRPFDFGLHAARLVDGKRYYSFSDNQPKCDFEDQHGNKLSIRARFVPEKGWHGERLDCKTWPDGQWDYWPSNNWNSFFHRSPWMVVSHYLRGWNMSHMEGIHDRVGFEAYSRTEMAWANEKNPDGASSYYLYYSPIMNGLHYLGLVFGIQCLPDFVPGGILYPVWNKMYGHSYRGEQRFWRMFDYPREPRQCGKMFLYYMDRCGDGYVDTYILDGENDGYFEKRAWHDRKNDLVSIYDGGQLGVIKTKLELPGYKIELKNYNDLVALRRGSYEKEGLLWKLKIKDNALQGGEDNGFAFVLAEDWLPHVAVDVFHANGKKDAWSDFEATGLDTFGRIISQSEILVGALKEKYSSQSLSKIDMLVVLDIAVMPEKDEVEALKAYLESGGMVMLLAGTEKPEELTPMVYLAKCFDIAIQKEVLSVVPKETELSKEYNATHDYIADPSRCWGPYAEEMGVKDRAGAGLLKGVKALFFDSYDIEGGEALIEHTGRALIVTKRIGQGMLVVIPSNLFHNRYMCMDKKLREFLFEKPGNQRLSETLVAHLLRGKQVAITNVDCSNQKVVVGLSGKGGNVHFRVPWAQAAIEVNGKVAPAETKDGVASVTVPAGTSKVVITPKK